MQGIFIITFVNMHLEIWVVLSHFLYKFEVVITEGSLRACRSLSSIVFSNEVITIFLILNRRANRIMVRDRVRWGAKFRLAGIPDLDIRMVIVSVAASVHWRYSDMASIWVLSYVHVTETCLSPRVNLLL